MYAKNNNLPVVKPFILIVCKSIQHATDTYNLIKNGMFDGRYADKILQIDSSTKKDEEIENSLFRLKS